MATVVIATLVMTAVVLDIVAVVAAVLLEAVVAAVAVLFAVLCHTIVVDAVRDTGRAARIADVFGLVTRTGNVYARERRRRTLAAVSEAGVVVQAVGGTASRLA